MTLIQNILLSVSKSTVVVIAVDNGDKPAGLTSLLECMALGRPVIISNGASSRDYVRDTETGFMYEEGNWRDLGKRLFIYLITPRWRKKSVLPPANLRKRILAFQYAVSGSFNIYVICGL